MTVARPLPSVLDNLIAAGAVILIQPTESVEWLPLLLDLQAELLAWKGVTRFAEWILLGALVSLASAAAGSDLAARLRFIRIATDSMGLVQGRLTDLRRAGVKQ